MAVIGLTGGDIANTASSPTAEPRSAEIRRLKLAPSYNRAKKHQLSGVRGKKYSIASPTSALIVEL